MINGERQRRRALDKKIRKITSTVEKTANEQADNAFDIFN